MYKLLLSCIVGKGNKTCVMYMAVNINSFITSYVQNQVGLSFVDRLRRFCGAQKNPLA